ncbi:hypothetical protein EVJ27_04415 [Exiguobacterium sp. SH3S2]|uniref:hypothetical protein n=1 Tax=unclassified Exiguobacterium TaxID=2644629 RepID=UPI00103CDFC1|nr:MULTISPECIES: hypothetical protein [unclassified Exiguobacterium]TCI47374.1 hypothetical protein EVJ28_04410 [Exiguobacterium sp. SH3S3]TCI62521.1 hypothetical protein EVJ27_04415 [Exiguobacterium sp. SH3S2]
MVHQFEMERIWIDETELFYQVKLQLYASVCSSNQDVYMQDDMLQELVDVASRFNDARGKEPVVWQPMGEDSNDLQIKMAFNLIDRTGTIQVDVFIHDEWQHDPFDHFHAAFKFRTTMGQLDDLSAQLKRFIHRETDRVSSLYER